MAGYEVHSCSFINETDGHMHGFNCNLISETFILVGFVVNETSDSFSLKCQGSDIRKTNSFGLHTGLIIVGTIAGIRNGFQRDEPFWFAALPS